MTARLPACGAARRMWLGGAASRGTPTSVHFLIPCVVSCLPLSMGPLCGGGGLRRAEAGDCVLLSPSPCVTGASPVLLSELSDDTTDNAAGCACKAVVPPFDALQTRLGGLCCGGWSIAHPLRQI
jgi:hypothetical protein